MSDVLVIAAHPDDETYGVGGTIARHVAEGESVTVFIATDGVTARHDVKSPQKAAARRACERLGIEDVRFGDMPDQRLDETALLDCVLPISALIAELHPRIVYTHHGGDVNQDHRVLFEATMVAVRPFGSNTVRQVLAYEVASSTEWAPALPGWQFQPNVFVDIGPYLEQKLHAVDAYRDTHESEVKPFPHPRSPEAVRIYAQHRGVSVGLSAAEAFNQIRDIRV